MDSGADKHFELAAKFAVEGLRAVILVNGGAAIALIALAGNLGADATQSFSTAVVMFGSGAVAGVIATGAAYFSQLQYANHLVMQDADNGQEAQKRLGQHSVLSKAATFFVIVSIGFGVSGIAFALFAVSI